MKTSIELSIRLYAYHGVLPQEEKVGNWFTVQLMVTYPFENAMAPDDLTDTISYADLADIIKSEMAIPSKLLEHVAGRIINALQTRYPQITAGKITITKENPPIPAPTPTATIIVEW